LPGISGGVLCMAFGLYEPMMALLAHPIKNFRPQGGMLLPFLVGWAAGFVLLAGAVEWFFETASVVATMLFVGLICGTVPQLFRNSAESCPKSSWTPFVLSLAGAFTLFGILDRTAAGTITPNTLWYLFCGAVWGMSLIIPGLSSSSVLIFLGLYKPMTAGIAALDPDVILPLLAGLFAVVLPTAKYVNGLFEHRYAFASRVVLGVMIASTLWIIPLTYGSASLLLESLAAFCAGFFISRKMDMAKIAPFAQETSGRE
jgi:putative membrane protein